MAVLLGSERSLGLVPATAEAAAGEAAPPVVARPAADLQADG
jgi:hypothetical protein